MDVADLSSSRIRGIEVTRTPRNLLLYELLLLLTSLPTIYPKLMVDESLPFLLGNMFLHPRTGLDRLEAYQTGMDD